MTQKPHQINARFQGYLPVVVDLETGGVQAQTDALLEIGAVFVDMNPDTGELYTTDHFHTHVEPFDGAIVSEEALRINNIQVDHPFRFAKSESTAIPALFERVQEKLQAAGCRRALLVAHNAHFDLGFLQAAARRTKYHNKTPFHAFTVLDTATLSALAFGKTVLAKGIKAAGISFDAKNAHSALYDAQKTAELFCHIVNHSKQNA